MKNANFIMKVIAMAVIIGVLFHYQNIAVERAEIVEAREAQIKEVEDWNKQVLAAQAEAEASPWTDGSYEGSGEGFGGSITLSVTIADGSITDIQVVSAKDEDETYFEQAVTLLEDIIDEQSADVDTVSGATFSSEGLIAAAEDALAKAEVQ